MKKISLMGLLIFTFCISISDARIGVSRSRQRSVAKLAAPKVAAPKVAAPKVAAPKVAASSAISVSSSKPMSIARRSGPMPAYLAKYFDPAAPAIDVAIRVWSESLAAYQKGNKALFEQLREQLVKFLANRSFFDNIDISDEELQAKSFDREKARFIGESYGEMLGNVQLSYAWIKQLVAELEGPAGINIIPALRVIPFEAQLANVDEEALSDDTRNDLQKIAVLVDGLVKNNVQNMSLLLDILRNFARNADLIAQGISVETVAVLKQQFTDWQKGQKRLILADTAQRVANMTVEEMEKEAQIGGVSNRETEAMVQKVPMDTDASVVELGMTAWAYAVLAVYRGERSLHHAIIKKMNEIVKNRSFIENIDLEASSIAKGALSKEQASEIATSYATVQSQLLLAVAWLKSLKDGLKGPQGIGVVRTFKEVTLKKAIQNISEDTLPVHVKQRLFEIVDILESFAERLNGQQARNEMLNFARIVVDIAQEVQQSLEITVQDQFLSWKNMQRFTIRKEAQRIVDEELEKTKTAEPELLL